MELIDFFSQNKRLEVQKYLPIFL